LTANGDAPPPTADVLIHDAQRLAARLNAPRPQLNRPNRHQQVASHLRDAEPRVLPAVVFVWEKSKMS
jgi:hypothetical protein